MNAVILDTGPCLNLVSINQVNLMHAALSVDFDKLFVPRKVANEISDKSGEGTKFARTDPLFKGLVRSSMIEILESDAHNDEALVRAIKLIFAETRRTSTSRLRPIVAGLIVPIGSTAERI